MNYTNVSNYYGWHSNGGESSFTRMQHAHEYYEETKTYFNDKKLVKLERELRSFIAGKPLEERRQLLLIRKEAILKNLLDCTFLDQCQCHVPPGIPDREEHTAHSQAALNSFYDSAGVLDEDRLEQYIYVHREEMDMVDVLKFFIYIEMDIVIGQMLLQNEDDILCAGQEHSAAQAPVFDTLSDEFPLAIRKNEKACDMIRTLITHVIEPMVEQKKAWTWGHVMQGMMEAGVINMNAAAFGRAIHSILPHRDAVNVERSVRGFTSKMANQLTDKDHNIVEQVRTLFELVRQLVYGA